MEAEFNEEYDKYENLFRVGSMQLRRRARSIRRVIGLSNLFDSRHLEPRWCQSVALQCLTVTSSVVAPLTEPSDPRFPMVVNCFGAFMLLRYLEWTTGKKTDGEKVGSMY